MKQNTSAWAGERTTSELQAEAFRPVLPVAPPVNGMDALTALDEPASGGRGCVVSAAPGVGRVLDISRKRAATGWKAPLVWSERMRERAWRSPAAMVGITTNACSTKPRSVSSLIQWE